MKMFFSFIISSMVLLSCNKSESEKKEIIKEPEITTTVDTVKKDEFINQIVQASDDSSMAYKVFDVDKIENPNNSQLTLNISLEDAYQKDKARKTLLRIYEKFKAYDNFENYEAPSVVAAYLYSSEQQGKDRPADWIGMFVKPEGKPIKVEIKEPTISVLSTSKASKKSSEEAKIAELKEYLATKGLDLCSIYDIIGAMEKRNGEIADEKFPDNAISRSMYQESLNEKDRAMLTEKYVFKEMTIMEINWYGTKECF